MHQPQNPFHHILTRKRLLPPLFRGEWRSNRAEIGEKLKHKCGKQFTWLPLLADGQGINNTQSSHLLAQGDPRFSLNKTTLPMELVWQLEIGGTEPARLPNPYEASAFLSVRALSIHLATIEGLPPSWSEREQPSQGSLAARCGFRLPVPFQQQPGCEPCP